MTWLFLSLFAGAHPVHVFTCQPPPEFIRVLRQGGPRTPADCRLFEEVEREAREIDKKISARTAAFFFESRSMFMPGGPPKIYLLDGPVEGSAPLDSIQIELFNEFDRLAGDVRVKLDHIRFVPRHPNHWYVELDKVVMGDLRLLRHNSSDRPHRTRARVTFRAVAPGESFAFDLAPPVFKELLKRLRPAAVVRRWHGCEVYLNERLGPAVRKAFGA